MTENEAIEVLSNELIVIADMIGYCKDFEKESDLALAYRVKRKEAHIIAISALKEIQQYREIGTVEECREAVEKQVNRMSEICDKCLTCHWYCDDVLEECKGQEEPCHEYSPCMEIRRVGEPNE